MSAEAPRVAGPGIHWQVFGHLYCEGETPPQLCNPRARSTRDPRLITCPWCRRGWEIFSKKKSANPLDSLKG